MLFLSGSVSGSVLCHHGLGESSQPGVSAGRGGLRPWPVPAGAGFSGLRRPGPGRWELWEEGSDPQALRLAGDPAGSRALPSLWACASIFCEIRNWNVPGGLSNGSINIEVPLDAQLGKSSLTISSRNTPLEVSLTPGSNMSP